MKRLALIALLTLPVIASRGASACDECNAAGTTSIGETRVMGNGIAYSWMKLNSDRQPLAVGVSFTETAFAGLPEPEPNMKEMPEYTLRMPAEAAATPIDHVGLNWNPKGHDPSGLYDVPHFDLHFYTITPKERGQITAQGDDVAKCEKQPAGGHLPAGYVFAPNSAMPGMGGHWIDPASREFLGQGFTRTLIYGSYDGKVVFIEPMVTKAYLESQPYETEPIKQPVVFEKSAYYPTTYTIKYDPVRKEYSVVLGTMRHREATAAVAGR
jgi:hypothetical protein